MTTDAQAPADALAPVEQLRQENQVLRAVIAELEKRVADLVAENRALRDQLDEAQRQAARQAAPFRRRDSQKVPDAQRKRPGRPKGHPGVHRAVPAHFDEQIEVPLPACPHCGGAVAGVEPIEQVYLISSTAEEVCACVSVSPWKQGPARWAGAVSRPEPPAIVGANHLYIGTCGREE